MAGIAPIKFETIPEEIRAFQFLGGKENAQAIIGFFVESNDVSKYEWTENLTNTVNQGRVTFRVHESIQFEGPSDYDRAEVGDWIIIDPKKNKIQKIVSNEDFERTYQVKETQ